VDALRAIEEMQLAPHVDALYEPADRNRVLRAYQRKKQFPTGLINVRVPE